VAAPRRGVTVARIAVEQLTDMIEALAEFEAICARLSAVRMTPLEKRRLEVINISGQKKINDGEQDFPTINNELHEFIYLGSHSPSIASVTRSFRQRLAPFRPLQFVPGQTENSFRDHDEVVRAIVMSEPEEAHRAMRNHMTGTGLQIIEHFMRRDARTPETAAAPRRKAG
jgi:DNA-binding GntR family transcriptional regulator